jgi:uncharacterized cofD-like protein
VKMSAEVLPVLGRIYPSTAANVVLEATLANGRKVSGETRISRSTSRIERVALKPRRPKPLAETLDAISRADLITLGPGSLFTSVIPNLLVAGIAEAIAASPALKVYFVNLMSQPGETVNFSASDHVDAIRRHSARGVIEVCVLNTAPITGPVLSRYRAGAAQPVDNDVESLEAMGLDIVATDLLRMRPVQADQRIRHDPGAIAAVAVELAQQGRRRRRKLISMKAGL